MANINPTDAPLSRLATLFVTIGERRYPMLNAKNFSATATVKNADFKPLGTLITGKRPVGLEVKLSMTVYKCSSMFDELIENFKNTGIMPVFEAQITSEDEATTIGKDTKIYKNCVIDGDVLLSMLDTDGEFIEQTIEAYASDYSISNKYSDPAFM